MLRLTHVFLVVVLVGLVTQGWFWRVDDLTDQAIWVSRVEALTVAWEAGPPLVHDSDVYSEHPGMPTLVLASAAHRAGVHPLAALRGTVAVWFSLAVAGAVVVAKRLRPRSWWWLGLAGLLLFHPLLYHASPPDAVVSPLLVLFFLCGLWLLEEPKRSLRIALLGGLVLGLALATRWHIAVLAGGMLVAGLGWWLGWRRVLIVAGGAVAWMHAWHMLLWYKPAVWFSWAIGGQLGFFTGAQELEAAPGRVELVEFVLYAPLALLSIGLLLVLLVTRQVTRVADWRFSVGLLVGTLVPAGLITISELQSLRYYYPLIFVWDAFLPLWLLYAVSRMRLDVSQAWLRVRFEQLAALSVVSLLAFGQLFLLLYVYFVPVQQEFIDWSQFF